MGNKDNKVCSITD